MHSYLELLLVGAALLAAWIIARFPRAHPMRVRTITVAIVGAGGLVGLMRPAIWLVGNVLGVRGAIMLVVLPAATYLFLVAAWIMLFAQRVIAPFRR